jgi:N-methylhydantoinase A/oxoprolinase/acetone carboxylase beta subunit
MTGARTFRLGIDVGGTFTDFVLIGETSGELFREKCLTTPHDPIVGIAEGVGRLVARGLCTPKELGSVSHATTLVTNTIIERKGAVTGLLSTEGFRDLLELGSDTRYDMYDLGIEFPAPLIDRPLRAGVRERIAADGECLREPDPAEVVAQVRALVERGVQSLAVCFLHSYRNPRNERVTQAAIERAFPGLAVSISSTVAPEIREFERTVTVAANAYVKPIVRAYLQKLEASFRQLGARAPIVVMLSNGGMTTPRTASEIPIGLIESGPAAGVIAACHAGTITGERDLIAFDMGGTTAKACFIDDGRAAFTGTFEAGRVKRQFRGSGLPLKVPSVAMIEIGAGGGSIARIDATGLLKVGPESAGADPGPVCYARGGTQPTVTDADLLLGYLQPRYFLGGDMKLDVDGARAAVDTLARQCGLDTTSLAAGINEVVNQNMATAVRIHAAERGKDYRQYALFAFGGAGPVHAYEVARILGLRRIVCPLGAGTHSAFGLLAAPMAVDLSRSYNVALADIDWVYLNELLGEAEAEARRILRDANVADAVVTRAADMRFVGQGFELLTPMPDGELGPGSLAAIREAFHREYRKVYSGIPGDIPVEAITWRIRASGPLPALAACPAGSGVAASEPRHREVYFPEVRRFIATRVYDRYALRPGDVVAGPAVVEERESTTVIGPRGSARVDAGLHLVIDIAPAAGPSREEHS